MEHPIERLILCMMLTLVIGCGPYYWSTANGTLLPTKPRFTLKGMYQSDSITMQIDTTVIYQLEETIFIGRDTVVPFYRFFSNGRVLVGSYMKYDLSDSVFNSSRFGYVGYYASRKGKLQIEFFGHIDYTIKGKYIKTFNVVKGDRLTELKHKLNKNVVSRRKQYFRKRKVPLRPMIVDW